MKSYVTIEQKICPITGKTFDSGDILVDRRLKDSFEKCTTTGWQICPEVKEQLDKGFVALVEIDEAKSTKSNNGNITPEGAYRLGKIVYVRNAIVKEIFNTKITTPFVYVESKVIEFLESKITEK